MVDVGPTWVPYGSSFNDVAQKSSLQTNTVFWTNVFLMLGQRLRRWPNIKTTPVQRRECAVCSCWMYLYLAYKPDQAAAFPRQKKVSSMAVWDASIYWSRNVWWLAQKTSTIITWRADPEGFPWYTGMLSNSRCFHYISLLYPCPARAIINVFKSNEMCLNSIPSQSLH